jgi:hypothetical protein
MPIANRSTAKPASKPGLAAKPATKAAPAAAAPTTTAKQAKLTVIKTMLQGGTIKGEPVVTEEIEILNFAGVPTANVGASLRMTKNLGNMESVQLGVMMNAPCYKEEMDDVFAQCLDKAKAALDAAAEELQIGGDAGTQEEVTGEAEAGAEGADETSAEGQAEDVTPDWVRNASREEIEEVLKANEIDLDPNDYPEDDDLKQAAIDTIWPDGEPAAEEGAAEEETAAEGGEEATFYTREELEHKDVTTKDLQELYESHGLGKWPSGAEKVAKRAAINKILKAQVEAGWDGDAS